MNLLAHAYLSFDRTEILTGNMISDYVKGKKRFLYPEEIQKGIMLHRKIDTFTDNHPATATAKEFFRPVYRLYSGPFVDIIYDHFLALDDKQFEPFGGIKNFSQTTYKKLEKNITWFPFPFNNMFPFMKSQDWLANYGSEDGIRNSFRGLVHRAKYLPESAQAFSIFREQYAALQSCYDDFFPELKEYAFNRLCNLVSD
jgi:acyl carrier protein phosphodiesterase